MAKQLRQILVAIAELEHPPAGVLRKAGTLARAAGAAVELFHAIDVPDPGASYPETVTAEAARERRADIETHCEERLERMARDVALKGVKVTVNASWDYPPHEAIVRRALAAHADLVIAAARPHGRGARLLLRNTDWELIRNCPLPLLLVKSPRPYQKPVILAAVDPFHAHAKPAHLDDRLLEVGGQLAKLLRGSLHIFHAYMPLVTAATTAGVEAAHDQYVERVVDELAERAGIRKAYRHVEMGSVGRELGTVTRRTHASLVVMGAVSRSALARVFIGATAERVLDKVECDILIVKPRGFVSRVARTSAAASIPPPKQRAAGTTRRRSQNRGPAHQDRLPALF
jgi:universal stress protein E